MLIDTMFHYLLRDSRYFGVVFNHLQPEFVTEESYKILLKYMKTYVEEYSNQPTVSDLKLLMDSDESISEVLLKSQIQLLDRIDGLDASTNYDMILNKTEEYVMQRSCELGLSEALGILEENKPKGQIVDIMKKATSVTFTNELGIEYVKDSVKQVDFYTTEEQIIECDIKALNDAWSGGLRRKALHLFISGVNKGKSIFLCYLAGSLMMKGYNVVLISAEMSKEQLRHRIDANLLDMYMDSLGIDVNQRHYFDKIKEIANQQTGRLFIRDYPQGTCTTAHIAQYLQELKIQRQFKPDVLITDYLNEFASCRMSSKDAGDSYKYVKSLAGEHRALANELDIAVVSATQFNRKTADAGVDDVSMEGTADSHGTNAVADHMAAIVQSPEMREQNRYILKNIKTRFGDNLHKVFHLGIDRSKMRLFDVADDPASITLKEELAENDKIRNKRPKEYDEDGEEKVFVFDNEIDV